MTTPWRGSHALAEVRRLERERRFLLAGAPAGLDARVYRLIDDRYIAGTSLRLRTVRTFPGGDLVRKLTWKVPAAPGDFARAFVTSIYLSEGEHEMLSVHPARILRKRRMSYPSGGVRWAIDVFEESLQGLVLAEAELATDEELRALAVPAFAIREVTSLEASTGGWLAGRCAAEALAVLAGERPDPAAAGGTAA